jgi:hypothetical protein
MSYLAKFCIVHPALIIQYRLPYLGFSTLSALWEPSPGVNFMPAVDCSIHLVIYAAYFYIEEFRAKTLNERI